MAFVPGEPQDTTKIRDLGAVIRPNWSAIQTADSSFKPYAINLIERTSAGQPADPTAIADTFIIFSKDDGANAEFYGIDEASNVIQLSQDGSMGSSSTSIAASSITFDAASFSCDNRNLVTAWGYFNSGGVFQHGQNMATAAMPNPSTGVYNVETTAVFTTANVGVNLTTFRPGSSTPAGINLVTVPSLAASKISFQLETKDRSGSHVNLAFYVSIIGAF